MEVSVNDSHDGSGNLFLDESIAEEKKDCNVQHEEK